MRLLHLILTLSSISMIHAEEEPPVYLTADKVTYDKNLDIIEAFGNVEIKQFLDASTHPKSMGIFKGKTRPAGLLERFLKADHIIYNRHTKKITAIGHVVAIDEDKNVLYSNKLDVNETFDSGFIESVRLLLADEEGRLTASEGRRDGGVTVFKKVTYSPCKVCATNPNPLWQMRSKKVIHDEEDRMMVYRDVFLDFLDVPVLYSPYFTHPDPGVKRKDGLLMPIYGSSSDLGAYLKVPYYWTLGPHADFTFSPVITTKQGPILIGDYHQRLPLGYFTLGGSFTYSQNLYTSSIRTRPLEPMPERARFHVASKGRFELSKEDLVTFDINRASDTTYLRRYNIINDKKSFASDKNLTSFIKWEKFRERMYLGVKTYNFQTDYPKTTPFVFPMTQFLYKTEPGNLKQVFGIEGYLLSLIRQKNIFGDVPKASTRAVGKGTFYLPYITESGQLFELDGVLRGDLYAIHDFPNRASQSRGTYATGRFFPTVGLTWKYPWHQITSLGQYVIEPTLQFVASPNGLNPIKIPNEDSRFSELDDLNVFFLDRMNGLDKVDTGQRFVYGINTGLYGRSMRRVTAFIGQSYRFNHQKPNLIGDRCRLSDYVARLQIVPIKWFRLHYRGRFDNKSFRNTFSEISSNMGVPIFSINSSYVFFDRHHTHHLKHTIQQVNWQVSSQITETWKIAFTKTQNLSKEEKNAKAYIASGVYQNDCFQMSLGIYRTHFRDRDLRPDTGFLLEFNFKNLGTFKPISSGSFPSVSFRNIEY